MVTTSVSRSGALRAELPVELELLRGGVVLHARRAEALRAGRREQQPAAGRGHQRVRLGVAQQLAVRSGQLDLDRDGLTGLPLGVRRGREEAGRWGEAVADEVRAPARAAVAGPVGRSEHDGPGAGDGRRNRARDGARAARPTSRSATLAVSVAPVWPSVYTALTGHVTTGARGVALHRRPSQSATRRGWSRCT